MSRLITTEEWIKKADIVHHHKYDYSKVEYLGYSKNVCIICPIHGEFYQTPSNHIHGHSCPKCNKCHHYSTDEWIKMAKEIHGVEYDYSKTEYINYSTPLSIICKIHGEYCTLPKVHINGHKCPKCMNVSKYSTEEFINKANEVHNFKYDYSKVKYINSKTKIELTCKEHGEFYQTPDNHLQGQGCPKCKQSLMENEIENLLLDNGIEFDSQTHFEWLGRQSLDFYIESLHLAIECQGEQHFKSIEYFGGEETFKYIQRRDTNKKELCEKNGIKLLYYTNLKEYYVFLDELLIKNKDDLIKIIYEE